MNSNEVLALVFKKKGRKNVAAHLHLSRSLIDQWSRPRGVKGSGCINPLDRVDEISCFTGDLRLVQWLCGQHGGYFVPNPKVKGLARPEFLAETGGVLCELGHLQVEVADGLQHRRVSRELAAELRKYWEELKSGTERYVNECEAGDFRTGIVATSQARV
jgi:hypothetical protein